MASDIKTKTKPKPPTPLSSSSELPPSKINVQKFAESRAAELASLQSVVAARLGGDFRSDRGKRRRTTSFDNKSAGRRRKIRRRTDKKGLSDGEVIRVCRRARRREELKMNSATGFSVSGDGTKRLRTHVWHAKRFTMTKRWGFYLPLGLHGSGRGSRALLKRFRDGVLIHDSSYHVAVQLEGPEGALLAVLSMVLVPSLSNSSSDTDSVISGASYGNAMLHCIGEPCSRALAPVTYMWQSRFPGNTDEDALVNNQLGSKESHSSSRRLWVWIHASAFDEGFGALKYACQNEMDKTGILIDCFSLEGQLAKFELFGSKAFQLLQRTLTVTGISEGPLETEQRSVGGVDNDSRLRKTFLLDKGGQIITKAIFSLCVVDPRTMKTKRKIDDSQESASCDMLVDNNPQHEIENIDLAKNSYGNKESFLFCSDSCGNGTASCESLWVLRSGVIPPVEESVLCEEKHELHKKLFCLNDPISAEIQCSRRCCPIMLLKNESKNGLSFGWSVIFPLSWVKAFWAPLVSNGGHAIGLREKHWISCDVGLPSFPSDFPDCNAYTRLKEAENEASNLKFKTLSSAQRPLEVPILPPWESVRFMLNRILSCNEDPKFCRDNKQDADNLIPDLELVGRENRLDGFVARTSLSLADILNKIAGNHLLLYPRVADNKLCFPEVARDESKICDTQNRAVITNDHTLCLLRVLLHAYKEGSFEDGAVVCAPSLSDIKLWTSSLESGKEKLQLSHSALKTYFNEKSSGNWELQIPDDTTDNDSLRFPIGFVTTGFVRGSKKLVAEAFCEAVLLAHLRKEQWSDSPAKRRRKEVYVLVRNLRSTAYRLALATIVVEQQEEDLDFF